MKEKPYEQREWKHRSKSYGDVVHFAYVPPEKEARPDLVYIWDLDKTYLDTKFETIKGILRTAMEKAFQKKNIPGTGVLVRALKNEYEQKREDVDFPIYFITASPPQIEHRIVRKLNIDGIHPYGMFCKDNLKNLYPKRLWRLTQQVGFKLQSLLQVRVRLSENVRLVMFGDDSESDAVIYSLFSDICSRRISPEEIYTILRGLRVVGSQMRSIVDLQAQIPKTDPVEKIYINLASDTDADYYMKFGRRTLPTYDSFQIALDMYQMGELEMDAVLLVAQDLITNFAYSIDEVAKSFDDLIRRHVIGNPLVSELIPILKENGLIDINFEPSISPKKTLPNEEGKGIQLEGVFEPWIPDRIDYFHDYR